MAIPAEEMVGRMLETRFWSSPSAVYISERIRIWLHSPWPAPATTAASANKGSDAVVMARAVRSSRRRSGTDRSSDSQLALPRRCTGRDDGEDRPGEGEPGGNITCLRHAETPVDLADRRHENRPHRSGSGNEEHDPGAEADQVCARKASRGKRRCGLAASKVSSNAAVARPAAIVRASGRGACSSPITVRRKMLAASRARRTSKRTGNLLAVGALAVAGRTACAGKAVFIRTNSSSTKGYVDQEGGAPRPEFGQQAGRNRPDTRCNDPDPCQQGKDTRGDVAGKRSGISE